MAQTSLFPMLFGAAGCEIICEITWPDRFAQRSRVALHGSGKTRKRWTKRPYSERSMPRLVSSLGLISNIRANGAAHPFGVGQPTESPPRSGDSPSCFCNLQICAGWQPAPHADAIFAAKREPATGDGRRDTRSPRLGRRLALPAASRPPLPIRNPKSALRNRPPLVALARRSSRMARYTNPTEASWRTTRASRRSSSSARA